MDFEVGKLYHGFRFMSETLIEEINGRGRIFEHEKTGANLISITTDDDNKVFCITFKTPPPDNTGLPHILEHSVLCGSRKFPAKEPFVELAKGSLNTFLNAMTYPDKTMYPVASRNEKDLFNLMDVYLDATFFPKIHEIEEIFLQEGWHLEIRENNEPVLSGVVYNEMKGAFSSPEMLLMRKIPESLFPQTQYGKEPGGDPDEIPKLTIEKFREFHKKYYHPSNSYIFLYGNGDLDKQLEFLNNEYLRHFTREKIDVEIKLHPPFERISEKTYLYPISEHDREENKSYLSLNYVVGKSTDPVLYMGFDIIEYLLMETPAAPLKNALLKEKLGEDVFGIYERNILQPFLSFVVKHTTYEKKERFVGTIFKTLESMVERGIDKVLVEAAINAKEFALREADFRGLPKGLVYCIHCLDSWIYGADPFIHLRFEPTLSMIRKALKEPFFETLIEKYILKNQHGSIVTINPKRGLQKEKDLKAREELKRVVSGLSKEELEDISRKAEALKKRQLTPDPPEILEKIPLLSLDEINPRAEKLPQERHEINGRTLLFHPIFTSGIIYLNQIFDVESIPAEELPYISVLSYLLAKVSTKSFHYTELANEIDKHTGGISFFPSTYSAKDTDEIYMPKYIARSKAFVNKIENLVKILKEVISGTVFNDKERIRELLFELRSRIEMSINLEGHSYAIRRLLAYYSPFGRYVEELSGLNYYRFITSLTSDFEKRFEELGERLSSLCKKIFSKNNVLLSVTADAKDYVKLEKQLCEIFEGFSDHKGETIKYEFSELDGNEGLLTPGKIQFVAKGYNYRRLGYDYNGTMLVLRTILGLDYLWNRVRVQGGAYGCFARVSRNGNFYFCSYRDPNLRKTLEVYNGAGAYLKQFDPSKREMRKYIIGTISKLDSPLTPSMKGEVATDRYIRGITYEDVQKARDEVLSTDSRKIKRFSEMLDDLMKNGYYCVIGNEAKIKEHSDLFARLVPVFQA